MDSYSKIGSFTGSLVSGLLVAGTTSTLTTTVIMQPILDGKFMGAFAAITNQAHPTVDLNTGVAPVALVGGASVLNTPGEGCLGVYGLVAGVVRYVQGPKSKLDMAGSFLWDGPEFPSIPENFVPFAYLVAKAGATAAASIIVGSTSWTATGFTQAFVNICQVPSRPQVS